MKLLFLLSALCLALVSPLRAADEYEARTYQAPDGASLQYRLLTPKNYDKTKKYPLYSEYPGIRHDSWTQAYQEPELLPWLFVQRRGRVVPFADVAPPFAQPPSSEFRADTYSIFANEQGNAKIEEFPDLLHPNAAGYAKWKSLLDPIFAKLKL